MFIGNQKEILQSFLSSEEFSFYKCSIFAITFGHISPYYARSLLIRKIGQDRYNVLQKSLQEDFDKWCKERGVICGY